MNKYHAILLIAFGMTLMYLVLTLDNDIIRLAAGLFIWSAAFVFHFRTTLFHQNACEVCGGTGNAPKTP